MSVLDRNGFEKLLESLGPDRDSAGVAYEDLRNRMIRFFQWEGCQRPEDCVDETINRVAAKLLAGEKILNVMAYASGVSRLVLKETQRQQNREQPRQVLEFPAPAPKAPDTAEQKCFDRCFERMPEESRGLLLDYYQGDASDRIRNRKTLADRLGISLNSLRNRALRLREKLEQCMHSCLGAEKGS